MSFGFSVGDFLAAAGLIAEVVSALREAGGSSSQYRRLVLELYSLDRSLKEVDRLETVEGLESTVEAIKATALSCQLPLREFLDSIKKYDNTLGIGRSGGIMKDVLSKTKWVASKKLEDAAKLEAQIAVYLGSISLLLLLYQVKLKGLEEEKARSRFESLTKTLANMSIQTQHIGKRVADIRAQVEEGTRSVRKDIEDSSNATSQAIQRLQSFGETISRLLRTTNSMSEVAVQTYSKITEMYNVLITIQSHLPDTRHTFFQDPMSLEDAYGRKWPIPVEYDYPMVEGLLRAKFRNGRGMKLVANNQWQLFESGNPNELLSSTNWQPIPGMNITMAMLVPQYDKGMVCPRLHCTSTLYTEAIGGGNICSSCGTWFDNVLKLSPNQRITDIEEGEITRPEFTGVNENLASFSDFEAERSAPNPIIPLSVGVEVDEEDFRLLKNARFHRVTDRSEDTDPTTALGAAATVVGIASFGLQLSQTLYQFIPSSRGADTSVRAVLDGLNATIGAMHQVRDLLEDENKCTARDGKAPLFSTKALEDIKIIVDQCLMLFWRIEAIITNKADSRVLDQEIARNLVIFNNEVGPKKASKLLRLDSNVVLRKMQCLRWPYVSPKLEMYGQQLNSLQINLILIFQVVSLASIRANAFTTKPTAADVKTFHELYIRTEQTATQAGRPSSEIVEKLFLKWIATEGEEQEQPQAKGADAVHVASETRATANGNEHNTLANSRAGAGPSRGHGKDHTKEDPMSGDRDPQIRSPRNGSRPPSSSSSPSPDSWIVEIFDEDATSIDPHGPILSRAPPSPIRLRPEPSSVAP